ncbi:hypothetical protein ACFL6X_03210 [Candidatus Latescibacterota bacterium]
MELQDATATDFETEIDRVLGVDYTHLHLGEEGDLYVTEFGLPMVECLLPENHWNDKEWFAEHAHPLSGTSSIYRVTTKPANGRQRDIVIKWNRMGQEIPGDEFMDAQFNSPFEEFSLVMDLRDAQAGQGRRVYTQKPLAIFVPATRVDLWRTGRKEYMMQDKIDKHVEIELDMQRLYAVLYEWIKGIDAVQAQEAGLLDEEKVEALTRAASDCLGDRGFQVLDRKPHHVIVRPRPDGDLLRDRTGAIQYALVDYELLQLTTEHDQEVRQEKRSDYLRKQRDRFVIETPKVLPSHLHYMNIFGVGYIFGEAQSTGGELWVVGKDPDLYDYFLPERWEKSPRTRLSAIHEAFYTVTKDNIHLTWKVSRVGLLPDADPFKEDEHAILEFGYNSPFEEIAIARRLSEAGVPTTYPRAIYKAGLRSEISESLFDPRRYETHEELLSSHGTPILTPDRDYISIWGYWNGPDEKLADQDDDYLEGINALRAWREGLITEDTYVALMERIRQQLATFNVEDLNLRGTHILLSRRVASGELLRDAEGFPEAHICTFELLRMTEGWGAPQARG